MPFRDSAVVYCRCVGGERVADRLPGATQGAIGQRNNCGRTVHDPVEKSVADAIPEDFSGMTSPSAALTAAEYTVSRVGTLSQGPAGTGLHESQLLA